MDSVKICSLTPFCLPQWAPDGLEASEVRAVPRRFQQVRTDPFDPTDLVFAPSFPREANPQPGISDQGFQVAPAVGIEPTT